MNTAIARQPIFNRREQLVGYELLYRHDAATTQATGASLDRMAHEVLLRAFLDFGLDRLSGGGVAFLNFSLPMLVNDTWDLLPANRVVIELLEDIRVAPDVVEACRRMKRRGYRFALDDFTYTPDAEPLLHEAEVVKIDVLERSESEIRSAIAPLRAFGARLLAERVETRQARQICEDLGFDLFQGYFFARPETVVRRDLDPEQARVIRLTNLLRDPEISQDRLVQEFEADLALSLKLLRVATSAASGLRGIESIGHALRVVGRNAIHRWLLLLFVSSLAGESGQTAALARNATERGRFCELLAESAGAPRSTRDSIFLIGLFSRIDALLGSPISEILARISLAPEVSDALVRRQGPYTGYLAVMDAYEQGDWDSVAREAASIGVEPEQVPGLYLQALSWSAAMRV